MAENLKEDEQPAGEPAAKPSKLIPMILIANTLLMGGVLAVVLLRPPPGAAAPAASPAHASEVAAGGKAEAAKEGPEKTPGHEGAGEAAGAAEKEGAPGPILKLENFIIQLRGTDTDRYVRVAFDLELGSEGDRSAVQARMPHIRDAVISYFSDRSLDELRGSEGMERVKTAVQKRLDDIVGSRRVRSVFITELVIQ
jgi:flagellar FliL protein